MRILQLIKLNLSVVVLGLFTLEAFAAEPILIGLSITRSPPGSVIQGTQIKDAMEIYADMINAKGGLLGRPIKLVIV